RAVRMLREREGGRDLNRRRTIRAAALLLALGAPGAAGAAEAPPPAAPAQPGSPAAPSTAGPLAQPQGSGPVVTLTLQDAVSFALANNPNLHEVQGQQRQAAARIGEARAAAGPAINANGSYVESGPIPEFSFSSGPGQPPRRVSLGSSRTRTAGV